jgi:galactokinase
MSGLDLPKRSIPEMAYSVERGFIGVRGGIMDQYASVLSKPNSFLLLDCLDRSYRQITKPEGLHLFLINTKVQRSLKTSGYNERSDECARALTQLKAHMDIDSFRDIDLHMFEKHENDLDEIPYKRMHYVYEENQRLLDMVEALKDNDTKQMGALMYSGHKGLRDEFEVSIPELDLLVDLTRDEDWILGARMMGGGFGGCTINLATREPDNRFIEKVNNAYLKAFDIEPMFIPVALTGGTSVLKEIHK